MRFYLVLVSAMLISGCTGTGPAEDSADAPDGAEVRGEGAADWPAPEEASLRPGVKLYHLIAETRTCTANFVFTAPQNETLYMGAASHCVGSMELGATIQIGAGAGQATLVYCSYGYLTGSSRCPEEEEVDAQFRDQDFALVAIAPQSRLLVHPAVLHYGGPVGLTNNSAPGDTVFTYGNSDVRDGGQDIVGPADPTEGQVWSTGNGLSEVVFLRPPAPGDSGSPVLAEDRSALGIVKSLKAYVGASPPLTGVVHLEPALLLAEEALGTTLSLAIFEESTQPSS